MLYIYKIFDLNTSEYFSDVYFNTEDVSRAFCSAIKHNTNVEIHKLFLTQIIDLTFEDEEDALSEEEQQDFIDAWNNKHI